MSEQISTGQPAAPESVPAPGAQKSGQGEKKIEEWLEGLDADTIEVKPACAFEGYYLRAYKNGEETDVYIVWVEDGDYESAFSAVEKALTAKGYEFADDKFIKTRQPAAPKSPATQKSGQGDFVKCEVWGCQNPASRTWWLGDEERFVCEQHYEQHYRKKEERRKKEEEERRKKEEAINQARHLLTLGDNEINFVRKWIEKDDDSYCYVALGKRVPRLVYDALAKAGAVRKCYDEEVDVVYYKVDEAKATPILQKFGYKVISLSDWEKKRAEAKKILEQVGLGLWALERDLFYFEV